MRVALRSLGMQNVQADNGPNHKVGDRPFKAGAKIPLHDFRRGFHHLMPAFLSSFEWRISNFMIPVAFIDSIQGYKPGPLSENPEAKSNHSTPTCPFNIDSPP